MARGRSLAAEYADRQERRLGPVHWKKWCDFWTLQSMRSLMRTPRAWSIGTSTLGTSFSARTPAGVRVKILDFGVAKVMADSALAMGPSARTIGNIRMFAPAYGAPEQFDERVGAMVRGRTSTRSPSSRSRRFEEHGRGRGTPGRVCDEGARPGDSPDSAAARECGRRRRRASVRAGRGLETRRSTAGRGRVLGHAQLPCTQIPTRAVLHMRSRPLSAAKASATP